MRAIRAYARPEPRNNLPPGERTAMETSSEFSPAEPANPCRPSKERDVTTASLARPWNLRGVSLMAFAHGASDLYSGILPFVIFYDVARAGLPAWCQGALAFAWYLTSSIAQPLVGAYSDRRGRWWFLPASVALTAIGVSATPAARSLVVLVACVVLGGLGSAVMHPEAGRYSSLLGGAKRASAISIFQVGGQVGYGIGPLVAAALLAHAGTSAAFAMAIPGIVAAIAVAAVMPAFARDADAAAPRRAAPRGARGGRPPGDRAARPQHGAALSGRRLVRVLPAEPAHRARPPAHRDRRRGDRLPRRRGDRLVRGRRRRRPLRPRARRGDRADRLGAAAAARPAAARAARGGDAARRKRLALGTERARRRARAGAAPAQPRHRARPDERRRVRHRFARRGAGRRRRDAIGPRRRAYRRRVRTDPRRARVRRRGATPRRHRRVAPRSPPWASTDRAVPAQTTAPRRSRATPSRPRTRRSCRSYGARPCSKCSAPTPGSRAVRSR